MSGTVRGASIRTNPRTCNEVVGSFLWSERPTGTGPGSMSARQDLTHVEGVGNYALGLTWADGHSTGIYSFRLLRGICPCDDCGGEKR